MGSNTVKLGDLSVRYLLRLLSTYQGLGGNPDALTSRYGLSSHFLSDPDARISIPKFMRIGFDMINQTQQTDIGLLAGQQVNVSDLGLAGHLAMVSPNLQTALSTLCDYELLSSRNCRGHSQLLNDGDYLRMQFYSISPYNAFNEFVVDMVLSSWWKLTQWFTNKPIALKEVSFEYLMPEYSDKLEQYFGCTVRFNQPYNALLFYEDALNTPVAYANPLMATSLKRLCDQQLDAQSKTQSYTERVQEALGPMLEGTNPTLESVAKKINMPTWTLRRKLMQESSRFQDILDNTRQELAKSYIKDTDLALGEISYLLGFSSPTAFQRAFKRWSGMAPGEFRKAFKQNFLDRENIEALSNDAPTVA